MDQEGASGTSCRFTSALNSGLEVLFSTSKPQMHCIFQLLLVFQQAMQLAGWHKRSAYQFSMTRLRSKGSWTEAWHLWHSTQAIPSWMPQAALACLVSHSTFQEFYIVSDSVFLKAEPVQILSLHRIDLAPLKYYVEMEVWDPEEVLEIIVALIKQV